jgi:very-short-patch-repair endonuclease
MANIAEIVNQLGGMAQKRQLVARGATDWELTCAVRDGSVDRARQGWYTTFGPTDSRLRAVRVGGRLTGISAIEALGGWVLTKHPLHVSVPFNAARLRSQRNRWQRLKPNPGVVVHWDDPTLGERGDSTRVALRDALEKVVLFEARETAIAAFDWALHAGMLDELDFEKLMLGIPKVHRFSFELLDPKCESLPESLARSRLMAAGHQVSSQVLLESGKPIDLVVDGVVAVEVDGEEHHADSFESDRSKDIEITLAGYHGMRPSARMVFHRWPEVLRCIEVALAGRGFPPHSENSGVNGRKHSKRPHTLRNPALTPEFPKERPRKIGGRRRRGGNVGHRS